MAMKQLALRKVAFIAMLLIIVTGCAATSPRVEEPVQLLRNEKSAWDIFNKTFRAHGGEYVNKLNDLNVSIDGEWNYLITKIQPKVTDESFRQQSEERLLLSTPLYAADYTGPAGRKQVNRTKDSVRVFYHGVETFDSVTKSASALTADAFYIFALGPLALRDHVDQWRRLRDGYDNDRPFFRINAQMKPGVGFSDADYITLWVDKATGLTFRVHITLDGHETTQGAHVDTTYLSYVKRGEFTFPTHFFERVRGPIAIDAHEWWYTGIDINRNLSPADLVIDQWSENASRPSKLFSP